VSVNRLSEALWGDRPPRSSMKMLQNVVLRLRKTLGPETVETRPGGYALIASADRVDVKCFEGLVRDGRRRARAGEWFDAAATLSAAAALWRGSALLELSDWLPGRTEAARLEELRHCVDEELADAEMACGHHHESIPTLEMLVADEPLRERRWGLLMLALYRCGRQADALRAYQRARSALDDVGLAPGGHLVQLEQRIGVRDPSLDVAVIHSVHDGVGASRRSSASSSVVSLLVTDIVDSTRLRARYEREMSADLVVHDDAVAKVVDRHGGRIFKRTSDGAMAVFDDPVAGVTAGSEIQRALRSTAWQTEGGLRARVAVHAGTVIERDGEFFGTAVNRAVRLVAVCPPDAVVVSGFTAELEADRRLDGLRLVEVGSVHLRGFAPREVVYAVVADHLVAVGRLGDYTGSTRGQLGALPATDEAMVGRGDELVSVWDALQHHTVVSIVGVGGIGKTRLALEAATGVEHRFAEGVWWCDLAAATSPEAVAQVVLSALAAWQSPGRSAVESIIDSLAGRDALVILDNCEHVLATARELVRIIRGSCREVRFLITSREALGLSGEHLIAVSSLREADALELFILRAVAARPDLSVTDDQRVLAARICSRLDGIPLAIELGAARCRSMTAAEIDRLLDDRFRLLRSGRARVERHRTLHAAVAWSYDLLEADERDVFDRMAVFADGTYLDGLAAVTGGDQYDILDIVDRLVARSMVVPMSTELGTRYRQLETLRQFAEERLVERGVLGEVRDRHLAWVCDLARWLRANRVSRESGDAFRRYVAEVDNTRSAIAHAIASDKGDVAWAVVGDCGGYFITLRPSFEALDWLDRAAPIARWSDGVAEGIGWLGILGFFYGDPEAPRRALAAVPGEYHDNIAMLHCRWHLQLWVHGDPHAAGAVIDAHRPADPFDRVWTEFLRLWADVNLVMAGELDAELVAAVQRRAAAFVEDARRRGDVLTLGNALLGYARSLAHGGSPGDAVVAAMEATSIGEAVGAGLFAARGSVILTEALAAMAVSGTGDRATAAREIRRVITESRDRHTMAMAFEALDQLAALLWDDDAPTAYLLRLASRRMWATGSPLPVDALEPSTVAELRERANAMDADETVAFALDALERYLAAIDRREAGARPGVTPSF
jgi:predicted ATPase/class 3 adenylate cyclase